MIDTLALVCTLAAMPAAGQDAPAAPRPDVQRLLEVTGELKMARQVASATALEVATKVRSQQRDFPARAGEIIREVIEGEFASAFAPSGELGRLLADAYARHYTVEEVTGLIAFYESPLGRKVSETTPKITRESVQAAQKWAAGRLPVLLKELQDRLRTEGIIK